VQQSETDNDEEVFRLECLARHLLRKPLGKRRTMLAKMEKIHGKNAIETIKSYMKVEHKKIQEAKIKAKEELKAMLGK